MMGKRPQRLDTELFTQHIHHYIKKLCFASIIERSNEGSISGIKAKLHPPYFESLNSEGRNRCLKIGGRGWG